ncbi:hypothetical protein [Klebsiella pneumoniae]|nr:hypothetical protein [Klebsiella pneumoniae]
MGEISSNETLKRNNYANEFNWGKFAALCIKAEESPVLKGLRSMPCK